MDKQYQAVQVSSVELKNFRCFSHLKLDFSSKYVLIEGVNGVGKTSILEALYFACYLKSFRTPSPRELVLFDKQSFFVKVAVQVDEWPHDIQIGFAQSKRVVKVDQRPISSYKDLMAYYRVISLTEDDLALIQAGPHNRRQFLDHLLLLLRPEYGSTLKKYKQIVDQRNALLQHKTIDRDTYHVLSNQLWQEAKLITEQRQEVLAQLLERSRELCKTFIAGEWSIDFHYVPKRTYEDTFESFLEKEHKLFSTESRFRRTLFGAHLDDISIQLQSRHSRHFASRGQQKLLLLLLKIAQISLLNERSHSCIFLLDDFMTDFDENRARELVKALESLPVQLIFTSPTQNSLIAQIIHEQGGNLHKLTM